MDPILPEYEVTELPSRFIGYPEGTKVYVKPYSFGSALNIELVGKNSVNSMKETLSGVKVVGLPKNLLTPQDILFLGFYRNLVSSMHDKITLKSICPKCLNENKVVKTLKDIKFKSIEDFDSSVYPLQVSLTGYTMWFGFVSYKDFEFCLSKYRGHKLYQLALQVVKYKNEKTGEVFEKPEYNANTSREKDTAKIELYVKTVKDILFSMMDDDKDTLDEVLLLLEDYGLKPIDIQCQDENCKYQYSANLDDEDVFVMPFREPGKSPRDRIKLRKDDNVSDTFEDVELEGSTVAPKTNRKAKKQIKQETPENEDQITYFDPIQ